jgi:hypothetical protein
MQDELDDYEFDDGDYGFIIGPDGELKSMMIPEDLMDDPPKVIKKILKLLKVKDIHQIEDRTLH